VPAFIAVNYLFAHHADHNLYPVAPTYCAYEVDTVQVCYRVDLQAMAKLIGASYEELQALNPTFKLGVVPDIDQPMSLYLPKDAAGIFVANEAELRYTAPTPAATAAEEKAAETPAVRPRNPRTHTVRNGESLGVIARRYGVSVSQLKRWNGLRSDRIRAGQKLKVDNPDTSSAQEAPAGRAGSTAVYYVVQPGDTLWNIAQRHPGITVDQLKELNADALRDGLQPGKRLRVARPQG
jgi:membrane-bound lytic murein transglycosylase D